MFNSSQKKTPESILQTLLELAHSNSLDCKDSKMSTDNHSDKHEYDLGDGVVLHIEFEKGDMFCYPSRCWVVVDGTTFELDPIQGGDLYLSLPD